MTFLMFYECNDRDIVAVLQEHVWGLAMIIALCYARA